MYSKQIESKKWRDWIGVLGSEFTDDLYTEMFSKHFKKYYNGKITKRYARIKKKLDRRENLDPRKLMQLLQLE